MKHRICRYMPGVLRDARRALTAFAAVLFLFQADAGAPSAREVVWPGNWIVFQPFDADDPLPGMDKLKTIPEKLELAGRQAKPETVAPAEDGAFDFAEMFGGIRTGNTAYVYLAVESDSEREVQIGMGADWYMQAWINGEEFIDTTVTGNGDWPISALNHSRTIPLKAGENIVAVRFISGSASSVLAVRGIDAGERAQVLPGARDDDPVQGLYSLRERHGHKPWDLYHLGGDKLLTRRTIFRDRKFGTYLWMLDDSPIPEHNITASIWPAWNADASLMYMPAARPGADGISRRSFATGDFSRLILHGGGSRIPHWDRKDPGLFYLSHRDAPGQLVRTDAATGERTVIAEWERNRWAAYNWERHPDYDEPPSRSTVYMPYPEDTLYRLPAREQPRCSVCGGLVWTPDPSERIIGFTRDKNYVFLDTPHGGMWVTYEPDGEPVSQCRSRRPRHNLVHTEKWGSLIRIMPGVMIDRITGGMEKVIIPACGEDAYLEIFTSDRINLPGGEGWDEYRVVKSDDPDEMFAIYNYFPTYTHGHWSRSPSGETLAMDGSTTYIYPTRGGPARSVVLSGDGSNYHLHWEKHPRFFVGWVRGWRFVRYTRPEENANILFQVFTDGTFQPILDTKHRFTSQYSGADFSMQSPDATKVHYGSNMMGRSKNYVAVMARPRPPENLNWSAEGRAVKLDWEPSAYSRETRGYYVYRSERSGGGYELLTPEPVAGTAWLDESVKAGKPYYYVVTSVENSGLESGYSAEAARAGVRLPRRLDDPLVVYIEAENSIRDVPGEHFPGIAMGVDRREASDWYYVYLHPEQSTGRAFLDFSPPSAGRYNVWVRIRSGTGLKTEWMLDVGGVSMSAAAVSGSWEWVKAGAVSLPGDSARLIISTGDRGASMDLVCLASADDFIPGGPRPEKSLPPPAIGNLRAENIRCRVNYLSWERPDDPAVSHYQVYACREGKIREPRQELLIGSPADEYMYDWGLKGGARYYYAVTAVDRRGNESAPARAEAATPRAPSDVITLTFDRAALEGPFERSSAGGTYGEFFVVPERPSANTAGWKVDVPVDGEYYLWLRHLQRGSGIRGGTMRQNITVLVNGEPAMSGLGGRTDLHVRDELLADDSPLASSLWTWAWPGYSCPEGIKLSRGRNRITLKNLAGAHRYDALVITNDPSWTPGDGRLPQH